MDLDQALQTFIAESRELLADMETILLRLESEAADSEMVNALFRAAHTIKGSAGLFGLDPVVSFTHVVENVLDRVREERLAPTPDLAALLLSCADHMNDLVDTVAVRNEAVSAASTAREDMLRRQLQALLREAPGPDAAPAPSPAPIMPKIDASGGGTVETDTWHISLRFGPDVLRAGMDPLSFIRYLSTLGQLTSITTLPDALPAIKDMDPESCYLGFEIDFRSDADKAALEDVFEFVREESQIHILPPHSRIADYMALIEALPEANQRIGEILVSSGALTAHELEQALTTQERQPTAPAATAAPGHQPLGEILVDRGSVPKELVDAALAKQQRGRENRFVRVQADKLDYLIDRVGELVIAGAAASLLAQRTGNGTLLEATSTMSRLVEEIRDSALRLRMVEIGETFNRFQRTVRDVSRELGKDINLVITGGDTELDKTVVEKIGDPLTHLVRNSMDHGIEPMETRIQSGKPAAGTVHLNAYHDSGSIVIEVSDDGGGLKRDKILKRALERGIVSHTQDLTDQEILHLIFEPGFSTAEQVTNLSGRGVGMDVVKRNIEALRGTVELESVEDQGTTVRVRLPLTLAIIDGFLVGISGSAYVVPLDMVYECVELQEADRRAIDGSGYISLRGEILPVLRLRDWFEADGEPGRRENVVVVQYAGQKAGLVVDDLMGEFQTVIKPLGKVFARLKGISGSTILGTGEVALILDVAALIQQAATTEHQTAAPDRPVESAHAE